MISGNIQQYPLTITSQLSHAEAYYSDVEIVSRLGDCDQIDRSSWGQTANNARKIAKFLDRLGMETGDRIGTMAWNTTRHLECYFGISCSGKVLHTVNPRLFAEQIQYIANHAKDRVMFVDVDFVPLLQQVINELPHCQHVVILCSKETMPEHDFDVEVYCYDELIANESSDYSWPTLDQEMASSLCYTSGTTGNPKGVLYSHRATVLHSWAFAMPDVLGVDDRSVILPVVPMFHVNAWGVPYAAAMAGAKLVLPGRNLDAPSLYDLIEAEQPNRLLGVPTVWLALLNYLDEIKATLTSVERVVVGGSAAPRAMIEAFDRKHDAFLMHVWGMTELCPLGTVNNMNARLAAATDDARYDMMCKQGKAVFGIEIEIMDDDGNRLPHDGVAFGRLMVRGPWVIERYYLADESAVDADGWFDTGDVSTIDANGYMQIVDRAKDVIKSGGEWISSIDLENAAVGHADVVEACVVGVAHPKWDERPLLLLITKDGATVSQEEMNEFLADKVAKWWLPDAVLTVEELPHTATGKLLKAKLREQYHDYFQQSS